VTCSLALQVATAVGDFIFFSRILSTKKQQQQQCTLEIRSERANTRLPVCLFEFVREVSASFYFLNDFVHYLFGCSDNLFTFIFMF